MHLKTLRGHSNIYSTRRALGHSEITQRVQVEHLGTWALGGHLGTRSALRHLRQLGTRTLRVLRHLGAAPRKTLRHLGTQAIKVFRHLGTRTLKALRYSGTPGTLFSRLFKLHPKEKSTVSFKESN